jgi:hypothetical protein
MDGINDFPNSRKTVQHLDQFFQGVLGVNVAGTMKGTEDISGPIQI